MTPGDGTLTAAFTPPAGADAGTTYTLSATLHGTATPAGTPASGSASPLTVTGLTNGTQYDLSLIAHNNVGNSPPGTGTGTPNKAPKASPVVAVTPGANQCGVSITTPAGGTPTGYDFSITGGPSDQTSFPGVAGPVNFTGLTASTSYTITVHTNYTVASGDSAPDVVRPCVPNGGNVVVQHITGTRPATGALVLTQNCGSDPTCTVDLGTGSSIQGGAYFEAKGTLYPVTVTDTRDGDRGWTVKGQLTDFTKTVGTETFSGKALGWVPAIQSASPSPLPGYVINAAQGGTVLPWGGTSLTSGSAVLMSAPAGAGLGSATTNAGLTLWIPVTASAGTYSAVLTMTAT